MSSKLIMVLSLIAFLVDDNRADSMLGKAKSSESRTIRTPYYSEKDNNVGEMYITLPNNVQDGNNINTAVLPYSLTYQIEDTLGTVYYRKELGDKNGVVSGVVGFKNKNGIQKILNDLDNNDQSIEDSILNLKSDDMVPEKFLPLASIENESNPPQDLNHESEIEEQPTALQNYFEFVSAEDMEDSDRFIPNSQMQNLEEVTASSIGSENISFRGCKNIPSIPPTDDKSERELEDSNEYVLVSEVKDRQGMMEPSVETENPALIEQFNPEKVIKFYSYHNRDMDDNDQNRRKDFPDVSDAKIVHQNIDRDVHVKISKPTGGENQEENEFPIFRISARIDVLGKPIDSEDPEK